MPTTFANTIDNNEILAKRSQCDYAGADIRTTYATKSEVTAGLSAKEDSSNKAQSINTSSTTDFPSSKATADFVNSSVATNTAKFLGNFTLTDLLLTYPATDAQIETALDGYAFSPAPTNNDYVYVEIQDPQTPGVTDVVKRFKFDGTNWLYEYSLNNSSFTAAEIAAIDSGVTSTKVGNYDTHIADTTIHVTSTDKSTWNAKQDAISDLATIRSGASAGATAVQPGDLATVATTGAYSDLSGTPTIPAALSAGNGIDITNNVVSADLDGTSLTNGANGLSVTLPVPDTTGASQGDVLSVGQSGIEWVAPSSGSSDLFYATYASTTFNEIQNAVNDGKYVILSHQGFLVPLTAIIGTSYFAKAYFQTINNPNNNSSSNSLRLTTYICSYSNQWSSYLTFVPPTASASDAGKVLTVSSSGNAEWATPSGGGSVTDVEVNGTSVVNASGVAEVTVPAQVQPDWDATSGLGEILHKPVIPAAQVNADWDATSGVAEILNKPTIPAAQVNSDWNASSGVAEILNKPTILPYKPVVAGTGVRIVDDTANNRIVVEADETVLWANASGITVNTSLSITLSESFTNFERVRIVFARPTLPVSTEYMTSGNANTVMVLESIIVGSNNAVVFDVATLNLSGTAVTCTGFTRKTLADTTLSTSQSYPMTIYKIVGINRIASN